jgi:hypothetical protein
VPVSFPLRCFTCRSASPRLMQNSRGATKVFDRSEHFVLATHSSLYNLTLIIGRIVSCSSANSAATLPNTRQQQLALTSGVWSTSSQINTNDDGHTFRDLSTVPILLGVLCLQSLKSSHTCIAKRYREHPSTADSTSVALNSTQVLATVMCVSSSTGLSIID